VPPDSHTHTGHAAIDAISFRDEPVVEAYCDPASNVLLFRMCNYGAAGAMTTADRTSDGPDLLLLSRGAGVPAFGNVAGERFTVAPNRSLRTTFVPHGADSSATFGVSAHSINLMFPQGYLGKLVAELPRSTLDPHIFSNDQHLAQLIRMLDSEIAAPGFASSILVEGLTRAIASLLTRTDPAVAAREADHIYLPPWKLRRLYDYIEAHLDQRIRLEDLAVVVQLSPFHFSRVFKRATGISPYQYVRNRRLERSRELLSTSDLPIAELALVCGFSNQSHFTVAFSKAMGISPMRYRRSVADD